MKSRGNPMRPHEGAMRALGDMPMDSGTQLPDRSEGLARALVRRDGALTNPPNRVVRENLRREVANDTAFLLRQREVQESSNIISQAHPIQDVPFFGKFITFSSGVQTISPSPAADGVISVITGLGSRRIAFIRSVDIILLDASADDDLTFSARVAGVNTEGFTGIRADALAECCANTYLRIMENQNFDVVVANASTVNTHDIIVRVRGWQYTVPEVKETSRGVIPKLT